MMPVKLSSGKKSFKEIKVFLEEYCFDGFSLAIYDIRSECTMEIQCGYDDIFEIIKHVSDAEHTHPKWIGVNELSGSYVVGMNFKKGNYSAPSIWVYENGELKLRIGREELVRMMEKIFGSANL